jgi:hypothetical protein
MSLDFVRKSWIWTRAVHFRIRIDVSNRLGENILKKILDVKEKFSVQRLSATRGFMLSIFRDKTSISAHCQVQQI